MRLIQFAATLFTIAGAAVSGGMPANAANYSLEAAIAGGWRTPALVARDPARHPAEALSFFGLKPDMTVVEIWPGGGYWTEILAPYLYDHGIFYAAGFANSASDEVSTANAGLKAMVSGAPALYGNIRITVFGKDHGDIAPAGSADLVVTFRNVHNWMDGGWADAAFATFYKALKPGGILGVEEHRGRNDQPQDPRAKSGYVRQDYTIALARKAGFELVGSSEVNANPKDTKDYPEGVWTLPPTFALGDADRAKYAAIGEADNFVLKFRKPTK